MRMTTANLTTDQRAELERDLRDGVLSWRQLSSKWGLPQSTLRDWCRRHGIARGLPAQQRALGVALADVDDGADLRAHAAEVARLAMKRIHADLSAATQPGAGQLDPRSMKLWLEGAALALELDARIRNADAPDDMENLTDAQLDALAAGRPWRNVA